MYERYRNFFENLDNPVLRVQVVFIEVPYNEHGFSMDNATVPFLWGDSITIQALRFHDKLVAESSSAMLQLHLLSKGVDGTEVLQEHFQRA